MAGQHVEDLFSPAFDDALTAREAERFAAHLHDCDACASAYDAFQATVGAVRSLPAARMPVPVHLPSTPPIAEQRFFPVRMSARWRPRLRAGFATGVAAAAAAVIVVFAIGHQSRPATSQSGAAAPAFFGATSGPAASCPTSVPSSVAGEQASGGFANQETKSEPGRPGQQLVVATTSDQYAAGARVPIFAVLTAPLPAAGLQSTSVSPAASVAVVPCVSVSSRPPAGAAAAGGLGPIAATPGARSLSGGPSTALAPAAQTPILYFTIPPGTAPGTVLHVVATVPAGYPQAGDPAFSVDLTLTVH